MAPSSSSSSPSSSSEDDTPTTLKKSPLDAITNDSSDDEGLGLQINTKYAKSYEVRKRREELTKHRSDRHHKSDDDSDASTSESEDEEGDLLTPHLDVQILKTLQALKSGDVSVYDKSVDFYNKGANIPAASDGDGGKQHKPKRYKDVEREQILEQMKAEEDGEEKEEKGAEGDGDDHGNLAYDEEQRDIRRAFLESTRDGESDAGLNKKDTNGDSGDSEDEDWIKPKHKTNTLDDDDEEAKKLWAKELQNNGEKQQQAQGDKLADPKGEVKDGDQFLMEFMTHRKWMETNNPLGSSAKQMNDDSDDEDSLDDLERMDDFESKYNFRFEEANDKSLSSGAASASGAAHSIVHYARSTVASSKDVLRRPDESRKIKRQARKERKAEERRAKEEKLKRLKNAKREELEGRMEQVRSVLGYNNDNHAEEDGGGEDGTLEKPDMGLGEAEEQMILKLMEGEYDADKFEKVMQSAYGEEYYNKEDEVWKSDGDVKRDLVEDGVGDVGDDDDADEGDENGGDDGMDDNDADDAEEEEEYYNDEQQQWNEEEEEQSTNNPTSQLDQKLQSKLQSELYKLDYEDIIGDLPTRFKYRTVTKNDYGLSTQEILFANDSTLKQFVSLKKMVPYIGEEEEYMPGTKRRKRFRQMLKAEKKEMMVEEERVVEKESQGDGEEGGEGGKKKRRRQKKKSDTAEAAATADADDIKDDSIDKQNDSKEEKESGGGDEPPEKKRRRRKKKQGRHNSSSDAAEVPKETEQPSEEATVTTTNEVGTKQVTLNNDSAAEEPNTDKKKKKKDKKKKDKKNHDHKHGDGKKKKRQLSGVEGVSGARLAAYGI